MQKITAKQLEGKKVIPPKQDKKTAKDLRDRMHEAMIAVVASINDASAKGQGVKIAKFYSKSKACPHFGFELKVFNNDLKKQPRASIDNQVIASKRLLAEIVKACANIEGIPTLYKMKHNEFHVWSDAQLIEPEQEIVNLPTVYIARCPNQNASKDGITHTYTLTWLHT